MNGFVKDPRGVPTKRNPNSGIIELFPRLRLNSLKPCWYNENFHNNLLQSSVETVAVDFYSKELLDQIQSNNTKDYDFLIQCASSAKNYYKRFRVRRLVNDTVPKHDSVTPKKAIRCFLSEAQLRTFLIKAIHLVFKNSIGTDQQIYKFVCLLMKLLVLPNRDLSAAEINWLKQLLKTKLSIVQKIPSKFRRELGKKCIVYLISFCCNILSHCFYITTARVGQTTKISMYRRSVWNKIQAFNFKYLSVRQGLHEVELDKNKPVNRLRLLPKTNGIRPIGVAIKKYTPKCPNANVGLISAKIVLKYLCDLAFPGRPRTSSLRIFRQEFHHLTEDLKNSKIYYCTGDLIDCFNKIDYSVLAKFLERVALNDVYYIAVGPTTNRGSLPYGIGKTEQEAMTNIQNLSPSYKYMYYFDYMKIDGYTLRQFVRNYAIRPQVNFAGKTYQFNRGILQGSPLSSILNDIFLLSVESKIFGPRGQLIYRRYVDDYVFFSNNKKIVTSAIVKLLEGKIRLGSENPRNVISVPRFSSTKVSVNFDSEILARFGLKKTRFLPFCGSIIDSRCNTLMIDYGRYRNQVCKSTLNERINVLRRFCSVKSRLIQTIKYSAGFYLKQFVNSYFSIKQNSRSSHKKRFLSFIYDVVLVAKAISYHLDPNKKHIKKFLRQQLKCISIKLSSMIKR